MKHRHTEHTERRQRQLHLSVLSLWPQCLCGKNPCPSAPDPADPRGELFHLSRAGRGAKYSGWLAGWFAGEGRRVCGMFMGGCNEDMATMALKEDKPPRKEFLAAKVFLSTGKDDRTAGPSFGQTVQASLKKSGFDQGEDRAVRRRPPALPRAHRNRAEVVCGRREVAAAARPWSDLHRGTGALPSSRRHAT